MESKKKTTAPTDRPADREPIPGGVWVTKYALTRGILFYAHASRILDVSPTGDGWKVAPTGGVMVRSPTQFRFGDRSAGFYGEGRTWHTSKEEALAHAQKMVTAKKKSIEKELKKIDAMAILVTQVVVDDVKDDDIEL